MLTVVWKINFIFRWKCRENIRVIEKDIIALDILSHAFQIFNVSINHSTIVIYTYKVRLEIDEGKNNFNLTHII